MAQNKQTKKESRETNALESFRAIMVEMNKHRLIDPDFDFEDEYFIPDKY